MKYKCNTCGHQFEGELYTTQECPECHGQDIEPIKRTFPKKWLIIALGVMAVVSLIFLLCKCCFGKTAVSCAMEETMDSFIVIVEMGNDIVPNKTFIIRVSDEEGIVVDSCYVSDGHAVLSKVNMTRDSMTYTFDIFRVDNAEFKRKWTTENTYLCVVPHAPEILVADDGIVFDERSKTFTITVSVASGKVSQFWLYYYDPITNDSTILCPPQEDSVFKNVKPMDCRLYICAVGSNGLVSDAQDRVLVAPYDLSVEDILRIIKNFNLGKAGYRSGDVCDSLFKCESYEKLIKNDKAELEENLMNCELMEQKCSYNSRTKKIVF